jgi:hypothetical protein
MPIKARRRDCNICHTVAAVARGRQPGADDRERDLPGHRPAGPPVRHRGVPAPVPAPLQPHLAGPGRCRGRPDGAQRLDFPADAPPLRRQCPQRPSPPQLRPHHGRPALTRASTRSKDTAARTATPRSRRQITVHQCRAAPARWCPPRMTGRHSDVQRLRGVGNGHSPPADQTFVAALLQQL